MYPPGGPVERSILVNRGHGYSLSVQSGTIAAALAQDAIVLALRADTATGAEIGMYLECLRLSFQTIVAFTTPVTAGRRLGIYRATNPGAEVSGGTDVVAAIRKRDTNANVPDSKAVLARIASTAGLTVGGLVREAHPLALMDLASVGTAGARLEVTYELSPPKTQEWCLNPGEYLVISNPAAMDAAGTWQLTGQLSWYEQRRLALAL